MAAAPFHRVSPHRERCPPAKIRAAAHLMSPPLPSNPRAAKYIALQVLRLHSCFFDVTVFSGSSHIFLYIRSPSLRTYTVRRGPMCVSHHHARASSAPSSARSPPSRVTGLLPCTTFVS
ncbi:hypothetical protein MPTK1_6g13420 [Marchantia polymorpha subsp. ruderalis]|uniref:Uncharacterized protein n=2 Tax=Marchantia polymorpha TaxID=3197 RepID=A0AAF6BRM9_MARPO|nr:hypothetical protein MARPO_0059s0008 [Marchantia polymorpha]BBN14663.1 hypothetical protein Mp_6g13420 [Marchantia polymorpha subsp. ruderalis]|eukprot:PTQ37056.1 hypothetical protein MARPO_0059s0008 [Marchantia polymorpha]